MKIVGVLRKCKQINLSQRFTINRWFTSQNWNQEDSQVRHCKPMGRVMCCPANIIGSSHALSSGWILSSVVLNSTTLHKLPTGCLLSLLSLLTKNVALISFFHFPYTVHKLEALITLQCREILFSFKELHFAYLNMHITVWTTWVGLLEINRTLTTKKCKKKKC